MCHKAEEYLYEVKLLSVGSLGLIFLVFFFPVSQLWTEMLRLSVLVAEQPSRDEAVVLRGHSLAVKGFFLRN